MEGEKKWTHLEWRGLSTSMRSTFEAADEKIALGWRKRRWPPLGIERKKVDWMGRKEQSWIEKRGEENGLRRREQEEGVGGRGGAVFSP